MIHMLTFKLLHKHCIYNSNIYHTGHIYILVLYMCIKLFKMSFSVLNNKQKYMNEMNTQTGRTRPKCNQIKSNKSFASEDRE